MSWKVTARTLLIRILQVKIMKIMHQILKRESISATEIKWISKDRWAIILRTKIIISITENNDEYL